MPPITWRFRLGLTPRRSIGINGSIAAHASSLSISQRYDPIGGVESGRSESRQRELGPEPRA